MKPVSQKRIAEIVKFMTGMHVNYREAIFASVRIGDSKNAAEYTTKYIRFMRQYDPTMQANLL